MFLTTTTKKIFLNEEKKNAHRQSQPLSVEELKQKLTTFIDTALSNHTEEESDPCQRLLFGK